jgi:hypothetical protein
MLLVSAVAVEVAAVAAACSAADATYRADWTLRPVVFSYPKQIQRECQKSHAWAGSARLRHAVVADVAVAAPHT